MVCVRVAFRENDGNHENEENDKDNSDSYKQGVECWIRGSHENHGNDKNHGNPGCKPGPHLNPVKINPVIRMSWAIFLSEGFRAVSEQFQARSLQPLALKCKMGVRGSTLGTTPGRSNSPQTEFRPTGFNIRKRQFVHKMFVHDGQPASVT